MTQRQLSRIDQLIGGFDRVLRTLADTPGEERRPSPAGKAAASSLNEATSHLNEAPGHLDEAPGHLNENDRRHAAGLMRVNHSGEVCAQALYQGQALTAKLPKVRKEMEEAAEEEVDHLVWCRQRLDELNSHTSYLNPIWYGLSFALGAGAGLVGDRVSLGFVAATEERVCQHLEDHLARLPAGDHKSRAVIEQMLTDEGKHAQTALKAGGMVFPAPVKAVMSLVSKAMTESSYRL